MQGNSSAAKNPGGRVFYKCNHTPPASGLESSTTTTTTTHKANLFRLSVFSIKILEILRDCGAVTNYEFCNKLGKENNYVKQYLYNLHDSGYIFRNNENWKWYLEELDDDFYKDLDNILYTIYNGKTTVKQEYNNGKTTVKQFTQLPKKTRQVNLKAYLEKEDLSEEEHFVVVAIARHYEESGRIGAARPYYIVKDYYEFRERVGLDSKYSEEDVQDIVISLEVRGILFKYIHGRRIKIGLTKKTIENIKNA